MNDSNNKPSMRLTCGTLKENWYAACTSAELCAKKPLGRVIMEEMIVLFRNLKGEPVALLDRCLHRNALLSEGDVFNGCIGCPYHGWTYDQDGYCVNIPSEGPEIYRRQDKSIKNFPCVEQDGLIWVYMGDANPPESRSKPLPMPFYKKDGWQSYYMITPFENNVTNLAENFMDVPHTVFVHAKWFRNHKNTHGTAIARRTRSMVEIEYLHKDSIGFAEWLLNPDKLPMVHFDRFYMPNITRVDYSYGTERHFIISSQITPISKYKSMVYTAIAFRFGIWTTMLNPFFRWYTRNVINQDVDIMDIQSRGLKRYGPKFMSTEADVVHNYIESLRNFAEDGEQGNPPTEEEQQISFWI
jgi:phenylpropionate dioxygenase-like ring-hydroxylating dioxygenase large terminal subunit